jgi:hypothetical protein
MVEMKRSPGTSAGPRRGPQPADLDPLGRAELLVEQALDPDSEHANPLLVALDALLDAESDSLDSAAGEMSRS